MVAINSNDWQKNCEPSEIYPSVLREQVACGSEGTNRDVKTGVYLFEACECRLVPKYGEVPFNTTSSLNHRAQAFAELELAEWDGIVDNDDADEKSGREGSAGRKDARDSKTGEERNVSSGRDGVHVETHIYTEVNFRAPGCSLDTSGTESSSNDGRDARGGSSVGNER